MSLHARGAVMNAYALSSNHIRGIASDTDYFC